MRAGAGRACDAHELIPVSLRMPHRGALPACETGYTPRFTGYPGILVSRFTFQTAMVNPSNRYVCAGRPKVARTAAAGMASAASPGPGRRRPGHEKRRVMLPGIIGRGRRLVQQRPHPPVAHRDRRDARSRRRCPRSPRSPSAPPSPYRNPCPTSQSASTFVAGDRPRLRGRVPETQQPNQSAQARQPQQPPPNGHPRQPGRATLAWGRR